MWIAFPDRASSCNPQPAAQKAFPRLTCVCALVFRRVKDSMERNGGYTDKDLERYRTYFEVPACHNSRFLCMSEAFCAGFAFLPKQTLYLRFAQLASVKEAPRLHKPDFLCYTIPSGGQTQKRSGQHGLHHAQGDSHETLQQY
eukprot:5239209-Amphidinium_carterae.1